MVVLEAKRVLGKTEAVKRGLRAAVDDHAVHCIVQIDGDLKQPPHQATLLVDSVLDGKADMVTANRYAFQDLSSQTHRRALSFAVSSLIETLTGIVVTDTACGLRAYRRALGEKFIQELRGFGYGLEFEQLMLAASAGAAVTEIGVMSNHQADATNAEKHEDGFGAICMRARELGASDDQVELLCSYVRALKYRDDFIIGFPGRTASRPVSMRYVGHTERVADAYSATFS